MKMRDQGCWLLIIVLFGFAPAVLAQTDPLPAWKAGETKQRIMIFVQQVTNPDHPVYVPESDRIAVFDNDGTLWAEQPVYVQQVFAVDRIRALVKENPALASKEPYRAVIKHDQQAVKNDLASDRVEVDWLNIMKVTHIGMTREAFSQTVSDWIADAKTRKLAESIQKWSICRCDSYWRI